MIRYIIDNEKRANTASRVVYEHVGTPPKISQATLPIYSQPRDYSVNQIKREKNASSNLDRHRRNTVYCLGIDDREVAARYGFGRCGASLSRLFNYYFPRLAARPTRRRLFDLSAFIFRFPNAGIMHCVT